MKISMVSDKILSPELDQLVTALSQYTPPAGEQLKEVRIDQESFQNVGDYWQLLDGATRAILYQRYGVRFQTASPAIRFRNREFFMIRNAKVVTDQ